MINAANSNVGVMAAMLLAVASLVAFLCRECRQRGDVLLPTEMWARLLCGIRRCRAESDMGNPPRRTSASTRRPSTGAARTIQSRPRRCLFAARSSMPQAKRARSSRPPRSALSPTCPRSMYRSTHAGLIPCSRGVQAMRSPRLLRAQWPCSSAASAA